MENDNEYVLRLSQTVKVRPGVFRSQISIVYAGMIDENTFSIAVIWSYGNNSMAYNLFFPRHQRELEIPKGKIEIISITKDELRFRHSSNY
jgi:hypothetical protein